jgi:hypothetical protein
MGRKKPDSLILVAKRKTCMELLTANIRATLNSGILNPSGKIIPCANTEEVLNEIMAKLDGQLDVLFNRQKRKE